MGIELGDLGIVGLHELADLGEGEIALFHFRVR